jgi:hypothetical protein
MKNIILITLIVTLFSCQNSKKIIINNTKPKLEVLLIGTFHFKNFDPRLNLDITQTNDVDVLTTENQKELEEIKKKISQFNPTKIFVEFPYNEQNKLDSLYNTFSPTDYKTVKRDEIYQLAFRVGKNLNLKKIFSCDFRNYQFPYDKMMENINDAKQNDLIDLEEKSITEFETEYNAITKSRKSLLETLYFLNDNVNRKKDLSWYSNFATKAGTLKDTTGVFLASEWYRRNLFIHSFTQKQIDNSDKRIMILFGASHIATFKNFIELNPEWKIVELKEIMEK